MQLDGATIAVTGATGFLGRYVVDALLGRRAKVVGVVRNPDRVPELRARGVELRRADLAERDRLTEAFRGTDAVVSNAALFSLWNHRWPDHLRTNVDGTRNVFEAIADAAVKRAVHVSSVAVYRGRSSRRIAEDHPRHSEHTPLRPWNVYAVSKALSEEMAWKIAAARGLELTAVRPCAIYGAHDPNLMPILRRLARLPVAPVPVFAQMPFVYAGDVAEGIALALGKPASIGHALNLTGEDSSIREFFRSWREAGGRSPWLEFPVPVPIVQRFDHSRATAELGWRNRPLVEGLRETIAIERG